MLNKPNVSKVNALNECIVLTKQKQVESRSIASDIVSVLSVTATPVLEKSEKEGKFLKVEGLTYFKIIYQNNEGNNCVIDNKSVFAEIIEVSDGDSDFWCLTQVNLQDLEFKIENENEIKSKAILNFELGIFKEKQATYVDCMNDFCILPNEVSLTKKVANGFVEFNESFDVELGKNIARVLDCYATVTQKNIKAENGNAVLDYQVSANIIFEMADENATLKSLNQTFDFKKTIECECDQDCQIVAKTNLKLDKLQVLCEEVDENMLSHIDLPFVCQHLIYKNEVVMSVLDAYSTTNEIQLERQNQGLTQQVGIVSSTEKIDSNLVLNEDSKTIEKVFCQSCNCIDLTKLKVENEKVLVEGIAYCNIFYQSFDRETELKHNESIIAELPFSTMLNCENLQENDVLIGSATPTSCDVRIKRSQELDILAEINLNVNVFRNTNVNLVSNIEIGEEKNNNLKPLNIYLVQKGNTYWDVAKQLSIEVEQLQEQNIEVALPSDKIEKVVYYQQKQI